MLPDAARTPSLSADARLLVYAAPPADDDGRTSSIWLLDRSTGTTTELTRPLDGLRAGNSVRPAISADGCHVVAVTEIPYDLFRDDDSGSALGRLSADAAVVRWCRRCLGADLQPRRGHVQLDRR